MSMSNFKNGVAGIAIHRQRGRNSSAQFLAKREGAVDFGIRCMTCGVYEPSVTSKWKGPWHCEDCGGNFVSKKITF